MKTQREITQQEIEAKRQQIRKSGMAKYSINGMSEDESIAQMLREEWSFTFYAVRDPYHTMRNPKLKTLRFRVFQIDPKNPFIPMGYSGCPGFSFECYDGEPIKKVKSILSKQWGDKYTYRIDNDHITVSRVLSDEEKVQKAEQADAEVKRYQVSENDSPEIREVKQKIAKLEGTLRLSKLINLAIRKTKKRTGEARILQVMEIAGVRRDTAENALKPDFCGRLGVPQYELTSLNGRIKRLKAKIK